MKISEENKHNNAMAEIQSIKVRIGDLSFVKGFGFRGLFMVAIERLKLQGEGDLRAEECRVLVLVNLRSCQSALVILPYLKH